jgi:hypothetical protein
MPGLSPGMSQDDVIVYGQVRLLGWGLIVVSPKNKRQNIDLLFAH